MSNVSRQIYRKLDSLLPDLLSIEPFTRVDITDKGLPDVNLVVFDAAPDSISFVLSRYRREGSRLIASPSFHIVMNPVMKIANVVTYKDDHYFHDAKPAPGPDEIGVMAQTQANSFLYDWLKNLKPVQLMQAR